MLISNITANNTGAIQQRPDQPRAHRAMDAMHLLLRPSRFLPARNRKTPQVHAAPLAGWAVVLGAMFSDRATCRVPAFHMPDWSVVHRIGQSPGRETSLHSLIWLLFGVLLLGTLSGTCPLLRCVVTGLAGIAEAF